MKLTHELLLKFVSWLNRDEHGDSKSFITEFMPFPPHTYLTYSLPPDLRQSRLDEFIEFLKEKEYPENLHVETPELRARHPDEASIEGEWWYILRVQLNLVYLRQVLEELESRDSPSEEEWDRLFVKDSPFASLSNNSIRQELAKRARRFLEEEIQPRSVFRKEGDTWIIVWQGKRLPPFRSYLGLDLVHCLLLHKETQISALQLEALCGNDSAAQTMKEMEEVKRELLDVLGHDPTRYAPTDDPLFDQRAKEYFKRYKEQLREEYESTTDPQRHIDIARILKDLSSYFKGGTGRFDKLRQFPSDLEMARRRVAKNIGTVLAKIRIHDTELFDYLDSRIKKGARCCYTPDPHIPTNWNL